ncbi:MAG: L-lactate dehydrogenase [Owenweeksia sp.]|nr:L-lactate dehydrogenase [Owenweeksia sp.]
MITAGRGGRPGENRLELLRENLEVVKHISQKFTRYKGILIIVSNPVDVLTYYYQKYTGIPAHRVIGTGTMLDTARLRDMLGSRLNITPRSIHAQVIGEHGDSEVVVWSKATLASVALRQWQGWTQEDEKDLEDNLRKAAQEIIRRKGATNHAIGLVTASLLGSILRDERRVLNLSTVLSGQFGFKEVALSLPCITSGSGIDQVLEIDLEEKELRALRHSSQVLVNAIRSVAQ